MRGSAKYFSCFALMSGGCIASAVVSVESVIGRIILAWFGWSFAIVAFAYLLNRPKLLLKRSDGRFPWYAYIVSGGYFSLTWLTLQIYRWKTRRNPAIGKIVPGLWFSRRLTKREAGEAGCQKWAVLDLTCEFREVIPNPRKYRCIPCLDGIAPTDTLLLEATRWIDDQMKTGPVLVHCALGHGRTGMVVILWLLQNKHFATADEAIEKLRDLRPTFGVSTQQREAIERLVRQWQGATICA